MGNSKRQMPTCTATTTRNLFDVKVGNWIIGQLTRTAAGFEFTGARAMDVFTEGTFTNAKDAQAAIARWYAAQQPPCD